MKFNEFLYDRMVALLVHMFCMIVLSAFLLLTGTDAGVVMIIVIVWALGLCIFVTVTYMKRRHQIAELEAIMEGLDKKYLILECAPLPKNYIERKVFAILKRAGKSMIENVSDVEAKQRDYREYIENWVHEIKVPITAIQLICENNKSDISRKIRPQLTMIDNHVERSLYYARLEYVEKDFIIGEAWLGEIVKRALSKYRFLLTQYDVRIELGELDMTVYTDGKWVEFMLGQILSNAIKYRSNSPVITISAEQLADQTKLRIRDNGIGIPVSELRRIFDKGFTGSNGRALGGATGMGLYLCQKLARELGAHLEADSKENQYTEISICFPKSDTYETVR